MKKIILVAVMCLIFMSWFLRNAGAENVPVDSSRLGDGEVIDEKTSILRGIECFSGMGFGKVREDRKYRLVPLFIDFDFDVKSFFTRCHLNTPGLMQFTLEPFISDIAQPDQNVEFGNNFLIKIGVLPETYKFQPYFVGGVGLNYMTLHTVEQGTQFNFNEYIGGGLRYFFTKNTALTMEYRYRHVSNAAIKHPNKGVNANFGLLGITRTF
ncbi:MAG: acyloxyacyl hydrolase [Candidatus Omnitrophota bacterium]